MRIFTAKGDAGQTDLLGERVYKDDPRIELLGALDETTSVIGLGRAQARSTGSGDRLIDVQRDLYQIMAELAFTDDLRPDAYQFSEARVFWLESEIARVTEEVSLPPQFVLPGDTVGGAALDVARAVVRRAERAAVTLDRADHIVNPQILRYLNRLSSLLFILARAEDAQTGDAPRLAKARGLPEGTFEPTR